MAERARSVIPGGVNSGQRRVPGLEELVVARAAGSWFEDDRGRRLTDWHNAFGPVLLGHADPDVDRAFAEAARTLDLTGVGVSPAEVELAERLVALVPSLERVLLTVSGTAATFHALRLARAVTGRPRILKFAGSYHGWHDAVAPPAPSPGSPAPVLEATLVAPYNDLAATERLLDAHDGEVAAVIVEPIGHTLGAVLPAPGFLEGLRAACTRRGTVLVFDEVITGFRHALGGYQSVCGVIPDLTALGKAMANGYPVAAVGGRTELMDAFSTATPGGALFAGTYNGHPACAAAALATIRKLEEEPVHAHVFALGDRIRAGLREVLERLGVPGEVAGHGSIFLPLIDPGLFVGYRLAQLELGHFELPLDHKRSHISYAHSEADADALVSAGETALVRAQQGRTPGR
jgi:glutamate-1-semialdehyde 2,1-aminomutase